MKHLLLVLTVSFMVLGTHADVTVVTETTTAPPSLAISGTYTGVIPSAESPVGVVQAVLTISDTKVKIMFRDGNQNTTDEREISLTPVSFAELVRLGIVTPDGDKNIRGYSSDGDYPYYMFPPETGSEAPKSVNFDILEEMPDVWVVQNPHDHWFGSPGFSIFFSEKQVKNGVFDRMNKELFENQIPLLKK